MRKQQIAIISFASWLSIVTAFMLLNQQLNVEVVFILGLLGYLMIVMLMETSYVRPVYLRYNWYLVAAAVIIFGVMVAQNINDILRLEITIRS